MPAFNDLRFETPRLVLRPFRHADASDVFAIYADPEVYRHIPIGGWSHVDESHQRIARAIEKMGANEHIELAIERREDSRVVGHILLFNVDKASRRGELGYALAHGAWGKGYVTEALQPVVDWVFRELELNRIEAVIDPRNAASGRVLERLGFTHEGTQRERYIVRGETKDAGVYGLLRRDWEARGAR
jgi:RimJ/RimL family protein N-acetyltransferase